MKGSARLFVKNAAVVLSGSSDLHVNAPNGTRLRGVGSLTATSTYRWGKINVSIPPLQAKLSDKDFGELDVRLPALTALLKNEYVPATNQPMFMSLPPLSFSGVITKSKWGEINVTMPNLLMKGADHKYAEIITNMQALQSILFEDTMPNTGECYNQMFVADWNGPAVEHIVVINEHGLVVDTISATRIAVASIIAQMAATGSFSVVGSFVANINENIFADNQTSTSGGAKSIATRVWVVNMDTGASSQYDNFDFNSFFQDETTGDCFGVTDDGIYKLDGDTDNGTEIDAIIEIGKSDLGTPHKKSIVNVYAGVGSSGNMLLKVDADGNSYIYEARSSSTDLKNQRFDVGKGLVGNYLNLTLMNQDGDDFTLETITFDPVKYSRKI